jgi:hypothetical protein
MGSVILKKGNKPVLGVAFCDQIVALESNGFMVTNMGMISLSLHRSIQGQDSSLGIFHAVAKVLYNKRMYWH